jgi:predicted nucleotidyltransferase
MGIAEIIDKQREQILGLAAKHGAFNVRVFGSVARGDETLASDVDFLVVYSTLADYYMICRIFCIAKLMSLRKQDFIGI